jgi:hypothetical protein
MARTGGCQCGAVRYESSGEPIGLYVCHCRECRKQSASAFGLSLEVPRAGLRVTQGAPSFWSRATDSGRRIACAFCPACGSRLWHEPEDDRPTLTVKAGSLDEPVDLSGAVHIWTKRKLPGVVIPDGARQFAGEPG